MSIHQLIDKLLNKWRAKIICLLLAIFLYIFHQVSLIDKKVLVVPLHVIDQGNVMLVGDCPSAVNVIVRAETDVINSISASDLRATVNLNNISSSGLVSVPISINIDEKFLGVDPFEVKVKPETVTINVDTKILKYVPIEPSITGEVAEGYLISNIEVNPSTVGIIGPESLLNNFNTIQTDALVVSNAEKNFTDEVNYFEVNKLIYVQNKGPYKVTVTVEPKPMEKSFTDIHIVTRGLSEELEIEDSLPNIDFTLSGTVPILNKYILPSNVAQIDLSEITEPGTYDVPVKFNLPVNIKLETKSFETVSINIIKNEIKEETEENQQVVSE